MLATWSFLDFLRPVSTISMWLGRALLILLALNIAGLIVLTLCQYLIGLYQSWRGSHLATKAHRAREKYRKLRDECRKAAGITSSCSNLADYGMGESPRKN